MHLSEHVQQEFLRQLKFIVPLNVVIQRKCQVATNDNDTHVDYDINDINNIVTAFEKHLASIDGGGKASPQIYSLAAKQVMTAVGQDMMRLNKENVRKFYVEPLINSDNKTASVKTVRNKLRSLEYFCNFLLETNSGQSSDVSAQIKENLLLLKKCLPNWRKSLHPKCTVEDVRRRVLDGTDNVIPEDITRYLQSTYATQASLLLSLNSVDVISMRDFVKARNHLLVMLSIGNAHRTGVLSNFTLDDYSKASKPDRDGNITYSICLHKTVSSHGAATIAANADDVKLLAGYMKFRKHQCFDDAAPFVFVNTSGSKMTQSNIAASLTVAFHGSGFKQRVSCTKLRKAAVTQVHSEHPDRRQDLAAHMCHRVATAEKHYKYVEKQTNSLKCSELIRQVLTTTPSALSSIAAVEEVDKSTEELTDDVAETMEPYKKRILWSSEDRDLVRQKFHWMVKEQKTPTRQIEDMLNKDSKLRERLEKNLHVQGIKLIQAVRDKLRSFFRWTKKN